MDSLTLLGLLLGFFAVAGGQYLDGGSLSVLVNFPALLIVAGGTMGAVMIQTSYPVFKHAFVLLPWVFKPPKISFLALSELLIQWNRVARQSGLLALEKEVKKLDDNYLSTGLEMVLAGIDPAALRKIMEVQMDTQELKLTQAAKVFESMGGYSPTIGIMGAVLGLIQVMRNLSEPSELGIGIAVAFVATIYGVGFANLVFLPIANKLRFCIYKQMRLYEMYLEGLMSLGSGDSPKMMEMKLTSFIETHRLGKA